MLRPYKVEWNAKAGRYAFRTPRGGYGFLSEEKVRSIIDADIDVSGARMANLGAKLKPYARQFKAGEISREDYNAAVRDYRDAMAAQIKGAHCGQAAAAAGGFDQMGAVEHGRTGGLLAKQYRYLENACAEFADNPDLVLGEVPGRQSIEERSQSYSEASRYTFERFADIAQGENGSPFVINILETGAHHCQAKSGQPEYSSCPGQSALGVIRFDDPRRKCPGSRICGPRCKCGSRRFKTEKAAMAALGAP